MTNAKSEEIDFEAEVRAAWDDVAVEDHRMCCGPGSWRGVIVDVFTAWGVTASEVWMKLNAFTQSRREEIRQLELELKEFWLYDDSLEWITAAPEPTKIVSRTRIHCRRARTRARLARELDALKRGMKEGAHD